MSNQINNTNSPGSINTISQNSDKIHKNKMVEKVSWYISWWMKYIVYPLIVALVVLIISYYFNDKNMSDKNIQNTNSPGSINTIDQKGNNIIVNLDKPQRVMNDELKDSLLSEIHKLLDEKKRKVNVEVINGADGETLHLYNEVKSFLLESGIELTDGMTTFYPSNPVFGLKINIQDPDTIAIMVGPKEI